MPAEPVSEQELGAYIDGALELEDRLAIEAYLATDPPAAARFMSALKADTALKLLNRTSLSPRDYGETVAVLADRLRPPKTNWQVGVRGGTIAVVAAAMLVALAGVGISFSSAEAQPPAYIGDAVMSYRTGLLRAGMVSQLESPRLDVEEIRRRTQIRVPHLPEGWTVTDVQIFPSDAGPALQIMIRTADHQDISIFAVRDRSVAPAVPVAVRHADTSVAYWRKGEISYALTGVEAPEALDLAAEDLAVE